jgi:serine/threonine protein kinase
MATQQDNWEAVKALFEAALEVDAANRFSFLKERCLDASVCAEVERLLAEHDEAASSFLSTGLPIDPPPDRPLGLSAEIPTVSLGDFIPKPAARNQQLSESQVLAGRFRIVRYIAGGGMGEVYEVEDQELRERVAIKTIRPDILVQPNVMARFKREVYLARKVTHPNICRIFDLFRHKPDDGSVKEEIVFITMELLRGKTLAARMKDGTRMSVSEALPLVGQMASALAAAHEAGIVHRDFKPGNVVLVLGSGASGERAVVTDFGLALQSLASDEGVSVSTGQGILGTPAYMAPEQLEGRPATNASDIYALGLVIYEMVTGVRPFEGSSLISMASRRLAEPAPSPRAVEPELSLVVESVVMRCLERDPKKRFAQAKDVSTALMADVLPKETSAPETIPLTKPNLFRKGRRRSQWLWLAVLVIAFVLSMSIIAIRFPISLHRPPVKPDASVTAIFPDRELHYYVLVQNYRHGKPYGQASRVNQRTIFKADQGVQLMFSSPEPGFLYILNQGPSSTRQEPILNTLFPSPAANGGSAQLLPGQELRIPENGSFIFDRPRGTEKLWLVWSTEALPELESLKRWVNVEDRGRIRDTSQTQYVQSFLTKSTAFSVESRGDGRNLATTLDGNGKILVHLVALDHE